MDVSSIPDIRVIAVENIQRLVDCLPLSRKYFTLLLAWDAPKLGQDEVAELFRPLVKRGLAYFCAWGNRCEEVHDAVDRCFAQLKIEGKESDPILMTTWHQDESLAEAVWFFKMLAMPSESYVRAELERFAVAVGNPEWAREMESILLQTGLH